MPPTPSDLLAWTRTPEGRKMFRYSMVSVVSVCVSEVTLFLLVLAAGWGPRASNITATGVATVPSYYLNRTWAWGKSGRSHFWKEVAPFWILSFIGLAFSTWAADWAGSRTHRSAHLTHAVAVAGAALGAFGVLWVGKFLIFNKVLFVHHPQDLEPALDGRTGIPG